MQGYESSQSARQHHKRIGQDGEMASLGNPSKSVNLALFHFKSPLSAAGSPSVVSMPTSAVAGTSTLSSLVVDPRFVRFQNVHGLTCSRINTPFKAVAAIVASYLSGASRSWLLPRAHKLFVRDVCLLGGEVFVLSPAP